MIRICDKEVYTVEIESVDRGRIINFLFSNKLYDIIILFVTGEGENIGFSSYSSILKHSTLEEAIITETVPFDETLWKRAHKIFSLRKEIEYLPVVNDRGEIIYFCYDYKEGIAKITGLKVLETLERNKNAKFIDDIYPDIKIIHIYDMNELSYRLYELLRKRNFPYALHGKKWDIIKTKRKTYSEDEFPDYSCMNIYSEGNSARPYEKRRRGEWFGDELSETFGFLVEISKYNCYYEMNNISEKNNFNCRLIKMPKGDYGKGLPYDDIWNKYPNRPMRQIGGLENSEKIIGGIYETYGKEYYEKHCAGENEKGKFYGGIMGFKTFSVIKEERENHIYLCGPCTAIQEELMVEDTILYQWQRKIDSIMPNQYKLFAIQHNEGNFDLIEKVFQSLDIKKNDILLFYYQALNDDSVSMHGGLDLEEIYKEKPKNEMWFADIPAHLNQKGSKIVADYIWENAISQMLANMDWDKKQTYLQLGEDDSLEKEKEFQDYLKFLKRERTESIASAAAIVVNCNPFTLGHRYLIEKAAGEVEFLYIFVVEEDQSFFTFEKRMDLVKKGVSHIDNVKVLPSGEFIISMKTFSAYFTKEEQKDVVINANNDLKIFSRYIAPLLNIKCRYVGEEPFDKITKQYNEAMKDVLPEYGIEVKEIPRKEQEGEAISASRVRGFLKEQNFKAIEELVPASTYEFLVEKYGKWNVVE